LFLADPRVLATWRQFHAIAPTELPTRPQQGEDGAALIAITGGERPA